MKPLIQIGEEVREMTDEEYEALLATGWTSGEEPLEPAPVEEPPALEEEAGEA
jgi:hypothetical protein